MQKRKLYALNQQKQILSSFRNEEFNKNFAFRKNEEWNYNFSYMKRRMKKKSSFTETNGSNAEIKYLEFGFPMIKKNTKETLNKFNFQRRKNQVNSLVSKRYQIVENIIKNG